MTMGQPNWEEESPIGSGALVAGRGTTLLLAHFLDHSMATQAVAPPTPVDGPLEDSFPEKDGDRQQFIDGQPPQGAQPRESIDTTIEEEGARESYQQGTDQ
jgi:hypothetical protein